MATLDQPEPNRDGIAAPAPPPAGAPSPTPDAPAATAAPDAADKPYIGPRTFQPSEWRQFFGRDREARDLVARIISERFTLFYAQSGAGKSSLINTRVVPGLEAEGFEVLPIARVSGHAGESVTADNIFVYNLLSSLHQQETAPPDLATMTISHFLDNLVRHDGVFFYDPDFEWPPDAELRPRVLIIDQFEEITTTNSAFWEQREPFFRQLGEALAADDSLWVVLSLREDFLAGLDRYLHLVNKGVHHRFYMQQLNREAAIEAICRPVANVRPFEPGAVEELVDNLLTSRRQDKEKDAEGSESRQAEFVEPVQLQAVCYQMWEKLRTRPGRAITLQDVRDFADVDTALVSFYEDTIADTIAWAATQPNLTVTETDLRHWFETQLVTEAGTRNMVFRGQDDTGGLPTTVADYVRSRFIMREVVRPGGIWYELVHDGFIKPIQDANRKWLQQQPLLQRAQQWEAAGRGETLLLTGRQLDEFSATKWQALGPQVAAFMEASRQGRQKQERRKRLWQTAGIAAAFIILTGAVLTLIFAVRNSQAQNRNLAVANAAKDANATAAAQANRDMAAQNAILSTREAELAVANRQVEALRLIDSASDYLAQNRLDAAILLSHKAYAQDPSPRVRAVLFQAMDSKIEQVDAQTPLRGAYPLPVDEAGDAIIPAHLMAGPTAGTLAALDAGHLIWWPLTDDTEPPPAQPFPLPDDAIIRAALFNPAGDALVTAGDGLRLWRVAGGAATEPVEIPTRGDVDALAFSGDGRRLAAAYRCRAGQCDGNEIVVWTVAATAEGASILEEIATVASPQRVIDVAFADAAGNRLIWTDGADVVVKKLDAGGEPKPLSNLSTRKRIVSDMAAGGSGGLLVLSGCDETTPPPEPRRCRRDDPRWVELWFVGDEEPFGFRLEDIRLLEPTYQPGDNRFLLVRDAADAPSLLFWSADPALWQANACAVAGRNLTADEWRDLNPGQPLEEYGVECADYPIHPTVFAAIIGECAGASAGDDPDACWAVLEKNFNIVVSPDAIRRAREKTAEARASFTAQRRTTALRQLTEAELLVRGMPEAVATQLQGDILAAYADICTANVVTDSPTIPEACTHGTNFDLTTGQFETVADARLRLWRFEAQSGQFVNIGVEAREGGDATLSLLNEQLQVITTVDDVNGLNPELTQQIVSDGLYTISVDWVGEPGVYVLRATSETPRSLTMGQETEAEESQRFWRIDGHAGETVAISVRLDAGREADPWLRVTDQSGAETANNDNATGFLPEITTTLPADGPYFIEVGWNGPPTPYVITAGNVAASNLQLGDVVNDAGGQTTWQFEGRAGDYVVIAVEASDADPTLTLTGPDDLILYNDDFNGSLNPQVEGLLTADGAYTIAIAWLSAPAPYTLTTSRALPEDATLGATLHIGPEQRLWRFQGQAGDRVTIAARALNGGDAWLSLKDEALNELAFSDNDGASPNPRLSYALSADGEYTVALGWYSAPDEAELTIAATDAQPLTVGQTVQGDAGQTSWRLAGQGELVTIALEAEGGFISLSDAAGQPIPYIQSFGDATYQVITPLPEGDDMFVEVGRADAPLGPYNLSVTPLEPPLLALGDTLPEVGPDQSLWAFDGRAGDFVSFAAQSLDGNDLTLDLYDAQFNALATGFDFAGLPDPQLAYKLPADGRYYLAVSSSGEIGFFTLRAIALNPAPLPFDVVAEEAGSAQPWAIEADAGPMVVEFEALDGSFAWVSVRDAQNAEVGFHEWKSDQTSRQAHFFLPEDGLYVIEVGGANGAPPYRLRVTTGTLDPLPLRESVAGGADGRTNWFFAGRAGDIISAAAHSLDGGDTVMSLYGPDGSFLTESDDFYDYDPHLTVELPADGVYSLVVDWQDWSGITDLSVPVAPMGGPYELTVARLEAEPLILGQVVDDAPAERRLWRFDGQAGDVVTLAATALSGGDNLWLRLLDEQLLPIAFSDNADGLNPRLMTELPAAGTYYLEVGWFGDEGTYRLTTE